MSAPVLVVTDDLFFWARIEEAARRAGREVARVSGDSDMEEACRSGGVRRILADLGARSVDVYEWARRWRSAPHPPEMVAFGHHADRDAISRAIEAGYGRFVPNSRLARELDSLVR